VNAALVCALQDGREPIDRADQVRTPACPKEAGNSAQDMVTASAVNANAKPRKKEDIPESIATNVQLVRAGVRSLRTAFSVKCIRQVR